MAGYRERLAERLVHERERKSYSQDTLALKAGVSPKTIKRIEEQRVDAPRPVTIRRIAEALDIDPDQLQPPTELETEQLARLEHKLDLLIDHLGIVDEPADDDLTLEDAPEIDQLERDLSGHAEQAPPDSAEQSA